MSRSEGGREPREDETGPTMPAAGVLARRHDALFLDLDGVLFRGDEVIPGVAGVLEEVRRLGLGLVFLTNNSSKTSAEVAGRLQEMGLRVEPEEVLTSAIATARLLGQEDAAGKRAYVIGERGLRGALEAAGIEVVDGEPARADFVVVGWDRSLDYAKLRTASLLVQRGARLIASNADASYPAPDGLWPGAGAILAAVVTTTGAVPTVVGKPSTPLFEAARELTSARTPLVVGDRLDTDIAGAAALGWDSLLVLTGASTPGDLLRAASLPAYVAKDLSLLLDEVPPARFRGARREDAPSLAALLTAAGLGLEGFEDRLEGSVVAHASDGGDRPGEVVATACVQEAGGFGILRSVAVAHGLRHKGLGMLAVAAGVHQARRRGIAHVSLFTETARPFFERLGFREVPREALPEPVRSSDHAAAECASAPAMALDLSRPTPSGRGGDRSVAQGDEDAQ